jgi:hypothetical protein
MKQDLKFKYFLLNEDATYLAGRIGDILNAVQDIQQNAKGMGTKQLVRGSERVVNQIRRILHTNWGNENLETLEIIQKAGVAIAKAIEEKDDLEEILKNAGQEIQDKLADMGVPINALEKQSKKEDGSQNQTSPPKGQEPQPQQAPEQGQPEQGQPQGQPQQVPGTEGQPPPNMSM